MARDKVDFINVILTVVLAGTSVAMVVTASNTDKTTTKQVELLDKASRLLAEQVAIVAREHFNHALDDAEAYCTCSSCSPSYLIEIPLDIAVRDEPAARDLLTAAEYNRLAILGSSVWDFKKAEPYGRKALEKSETPLDHFVSHLVLAHLHFRHLEDDPAHATIQEGRIHFKEAVTTLENDKGSEAAQSTIGYGYGLWAAHEAFRNDETESRHKMNLAKSWLSKQSDKQSLIDKLEEATLAAKNGARPEIACLFKPPVQCTAYQPLASKMEPTPAPQLAPTAPAPTPVRARR
jgi:hypothetical protein